MKKTAIYARSQDIDSERNDVYRQISVCLAQTGRSDVAIYKDLGSGMRKDRPELNRMMNDIRAGKIQCVVTESVVRLCRDIIYLSELLREMDFHGCTFLSLVEGIDTKEDHRHNQEDAIYQLFAAFERRKVS